MYFDKLVGAVALCAASVGLSAPLTVVATGDSITGCYCWYLSGKLTRRGVDNVVPNPVYGYAGSINTSRGGMNGPLYVGLTPWPGTGEQINYASNVVAANPDVIVFGVGVNDAYFDSNASSSFAAYQQSIGQAFSIFTGFVQQKPTTKVVIGSVLPFDLVTNQAYYGGATWNSGALGRIQQYNAWLADQAAQCGFVYCDTWSAIQLEPNWMTSFFGPDGLHPNDTGDAWLADQYAAAIVPEPSSLFVAGIFFVLPLRRPRSAHE